MNVTLKELKWVISSIGQILPVILLIISEFSDFRTVLTADPPKKLVSRSRIRELMEAKVQDWQELSILMPSSNFQIYDGNEESSMIEFKVYLYSSYYDWRIGMVRINSLIPLSFDERVKLECGIIIGDNLFKGIVNKVVHKEHHDKEYVSSTLLCEIGNYELDIEEAQGVSIEIFESENKDNKSEKWMSLNNIPKDNFNGYELSICVRPWWGEAIPDGNLRNKPKFNNAALLLEFINSYLYLGVSKFYLYQSYLELDDNVQAVIDYYSNVERVLEIVPYTLPIIPFKQVWDFAQTSMIQDCLLRNIGQTRYLLFVDTDEFVFPSLRGYNLIDYLNMMVSSNPYYKNKVGAIWVPMYFHFLEWESDETNMKRYSFIENEIKKEMDNAEFILYRKTCRMLSSGTKKSDKNRRKVLVRPERVLYMGIHEPEAMLNTKFHFIKAPMVNATEEEVGIYLHHYRRAKGIVNNDPKQRELVDMYLENSCSNKFIDTKGDSIRGDGVIKDNIVWEIFGTHLYHKIFKDIKEIHTREEMTKMKQKNYTSIHITA